MSAMPSGAGSSGKPDTPRIEDGADRQAPTPPGLGLHWPTLGVALLVMLGGTLYPPMFADSEGKADHRLAMAIFWAMSAGFVRGVGFVPRNLIARWVFSGPAVVIALGLTLALRFAPGLAR